MRGKVRPITAVPVSLGDLPSFYAKVERVGNTSITVHVKFYAERKPAKLEIVKATGAILAYIAIDLQRQPRPIPKH